MALQSQTSLLAESEVEEIRKIAGYLYINQRDFESIKAMFYDTSENAYKILEIEKICFQFRGKKWLQKNGKEIPPRQITRFRR